MKIEKEVYRKVTNNQITEEIIKERLELINKSQNKYRYELEVKENSLLEYNINIKERLGERIVASRGFFDKIEILSHIKGMEEFIRFI